MIFGILVAVVVIAAAWFDGYVVGARNEARWWAKRYRDEVRQRDTEPE